MSDFYITDTCTSDLCPFYQMLKSASNSQIYGFFSNSQIYKCVLLFFNFSNRRPMTSLAYALTLTNKLATYLRILEGHQKVTNKPLNWTVIHVWGSDFSRCQCSFEPPMQITILTTNQMFLKWSWRSGVSLDQMKSKMAILASDLATHFRLLQNYCMINHSTCQKCSSGPEVVALLWDHDIFDNVLFEKLLDMKSLDFPEMFF